MRFEELAYTVDGLSVTVPFHPRLTVVSVPGDEERTAWVARLFGVLEGIRPGDSASLVYTDDADQRVRLERDNLGGARLTDVDTGVELPYSARHLRLDGRFDWFASIGITSLRASELAVVDHQALVVDEKCHRQEVEAKLDRAGKLLARVDDQCQGAIVRGRDRDDLRRAIAELDERSRGDAPARGRQDERDATEAVLAALGAADECGRAVSAVAQAGRVAGALVRLDAEALARALARPTEVPAGLEALARACGAAARRRDELVARLDALPPAESEDDPGTRAEAEESRRQILRELTEDVEPAYADALAALADACRPFDVSVGPARLEAAGLGAAGMETLGLELLAEVATRAAEAAGARLQQALDDAESDCRAAQERLVTHRSRLIQELHRVERGLPDAGQLAARRSGLERRIAALEASLEGSRRVLTVQEAETFLLRRAAAARRVGRRREPLPLVMNDALALCAEDAKCALLEVIARIGETTQVIYLTEDPDILAWASAPGATMNDPFMSGCGSQRKKKVPSARGSTE